MLGFLLLVLWSLVCTGQVEVKMGAELEAALKEGAELEVELKVEVRALSSWRLKVNISSGDTGQIYEVQVARTNLYHVIHQSKVSSGAAFSSWIWSSSLPLQCADHSVRVRRVYNWTQVSMWSQWTTNYGQQNAPSGRPRLFPAEEVLQEGSSAHFCCIPPIGAQVTEMLFRNTVYSLVPVGPRVRAIRVQNLNSTRLGENLICTVSTGTRRGVLNYITFPPEKPQNLSCWTADLKNLICTWNNTREPNLNNQHRRNYTLYIQGTGESGVQCDINRCVVSVLENWSFYNISVVVKNHLGEEQQSYTFNITKRVFPAVECVSVSAGVLDAELFWTLRGEFTGLNFTCQFILEPRGDTTELQFVVPDSEHTLSVCVRSLKPSSVFSSRGRCAVLGGHWGPWSPTQTFHTQMMIVLDVWMKIRRSAGDQTLTVMWKTMISDRESVCGVCEVFEVCVRCVSSSQSVCVNQTRQRAEFTLQYRVCDVSVRAITHTGSSVTSHTYTPAHHTEPILKEKRIVGNPDGFLLAWSALSSSSCVYVVDWCMMGDVVPCDLEWRKVSTNQTSVFLSADGFMKSRRYTFNIYSCLQIHEKLVGYLEEQRPLNAPRLCVSVSWSSITLQWSFNEEDPLNPGFITGYKLTLHNNTDKTSFVDVWVDGPHNKSAELRGLQENYQYTITLSSCTQAGCGPESVYTITTTHNYYRLLVKVVTPLLLLISWSCCLWSCRKTLRSLAVDVFSFPSDQSMKVLELDDSLYEVSEMLRGMKVEDCQCCKVETVKREKSQLIFSEEHHTPAGPDQREEPVWEEPVWAEPVKGKQVWEELVLKKSATEGSLWEEKEEHVFEGQVWEEPVRGEHVWEGPVSKGLLWEEPVWKEPVRQEPVLEGSLWEEPAWEGSVWEEPAWKGPVSKGQVWEEPEWEEPGRERVLSVTNLTYLSCTPASVSNPSHAHHQDSGPISSDYVSSVTNM